MMHCCSQLVVILKEGTVQGLGLRSRPAPGCVTKPAPQPAHPTRNAAEVTVAAADVAPQYHMPPASVQLLFGSPGA